MARLKSLPPPVDSAQLPAELFGITEALRRLGLKGTELARAQGATVRLKLLKVGALIRLTVCRVWVSLAGGLRKVRHVGRWKIQQHAHLWAAAYNLLRLANLEAVGVIG